jgi:hypothetical protein
VTCAIKLACSFLPNNTYTNAELVCFNAYVLDERLAVFLNERQIGIRVCAQARGGRFALPPSRAQTISGGFIYDATSLPKIYPQERDVWRGCLRDVGCFECSMLK